MKKLLLLWCLLGAITLSAQRKYSGQVTFGKDKVPLMGVSVFLKGTKQGTATDLDGNYQITVSQKGDFTLIFSYLGMKTKEVLIKENDKNRVFNVNMEEDVNTVSEVVVTGFVPKSKNSFTGVQVTVNQEQLAAVGTKSVIGSLESFVPGLQIVQDNLVGSDPNKVPEISIRGRASFEGSANVPLFVVDGAEVPLDYIYDMDVNDIETATILKDASASALYGARAAAGVVVITTKKPEEGNLRFSYNLTTRVSAPDLSEYNLLNAAQKLEYERLAGLYTDVNVAQQMKLDRDYAERYELVRKGVNTNWIAKPLRRGLSHNHNFSLDGGDKNARYALSLRYGNEQGVMNGSARERMGVTFRLSYNKQGKYFVGNTTTISSVKRSDTPYGSFSEYVRLNPYDTPYDENGELRKKLSYDLYNPLYEASLGSFNRGEQFYVMNNFDANVWLFPDIRLDGSFSVTKQKNDSDYFISPLSATLPDSRSAKGRYTNGNSKSFAFRGKLMLSVNKNLTDELFMTTTAGMNGDSVSAEDISYTTQGYYSSKLDFPAFASSYSGAPSGSDSVSRSLGFFVNANFIQDNKYFLDFIYRYEGSSKFGKDQRFAPFWSIGAGWNLHNESFIKSDDLQTLKLRASFGYLGNMNFSPYQAMTTYIYSNSLVYGNFGIGSVPQTIGNPDLKWERTRSTNIGVDWTMFNSRWDFSVDAYLKETDNLLLHVTKAPSIGVIQATENIGSIENKGIEFQARYVAIQQKDWNWSVFLNYSYNQNRIKSISNALKAQNEKNAKGVDANGNPITNPMRLPIYEEGQSITAMKVVPSAGIDPATGKEIYITRTGDYTFDYNPYDKVVFGDTAPLGYGSLGTYLSYKNLALNASFGYSFGGLVYNQTLASRVEGANPKYNADERVFKDRWKQPGDITKYVNIAITDAPKQSSRFVEVENYLTLRSVSLSYEFDAAKIKKWHLRRLRLEALSNDLFYLSTVKQERGLDYPFSRSFELSLRVSF